MKKIFILVSITLLFIAATVNKANAQSFAIDVIDNGSTIGYWDGSGTLYAYGTGYAGCNLACVPYVPGYDYVWSVQPYSGTPYQIQPNFVNSPFAFIYLWVPQSGMGVVDVCCKVYNGSTLVYTAYRNLMVL